MQDADRRGSASVASSIADIHSHPHSPNRSLTNSRVDHVGGTDAAENASCCTTFSASTKRTVRRLAIGVPVSLLVCCSWTACCVAAAQTYKRNVYEVKNGNVTEEAVPPFLLTYASLSMLMFCYPIFVAVSAVMQRGDCEIREMIKRDSFVLGGEHLKLVKKVIRCALFSSLWLVGTYCLYRSFQWVTVMDLVTMYSVQPCFAYLLCWIVLHKKFIALRVIAFIFGTSGVIMYMHIDGYSLLWYKVMGTFSAGSLAIFKVLFRRIVFYPTVGQYCLFLSVIGMCSFLFLWPLVLVLSVFTTAEPINWTSFPFHWFIVAVFCYLIYHATIFTAKEVTFKFMIDFGVLLAIPLTALVEALWLPGKIEEFKPMKIAGLYLVAQAFFMTSLPDDWHKCIINVMKKKKKSRPSGSVSGGSGNGGAGVVAGPGGAASGRHRASSASITSLHNLGFGRSRLKSTTSVTMNGLLQA